MRLMTVEELDALEFLGDFGPTVNVMDCTVKGSMDGYKVYLSSTELRQLATSLSSVAQWLDERATEEESK